MRLLKLTEEVGEVADALVALFGRWNWWLPRRAGRVAVTADATVRSEEKI